jgi:hypothetical protein
LAASKGPLPTLSRKGKGNLKELRAVIDRNEAAGWQNRVEVELPYVLGHENVGWVGNYTELSELTTLNAEGKVKLHTQRYPLGRRRHGGLRPGAGTHQGPRSPDPERGRQPRGRTGGDAAAKHSIGPQRIPPPPTGLSAERAVQGDLVQRALENGELLIVKSGHE